MLIFAHQRCIVVVVMPKYTMYYPKTQRPHSRRNEGAAGHGIPGRLFGGVVALVGVEPSSHLSSTSEPDSNRHQYGGQESNLHSRTAIPIKRTLACILFALCSRMRSGEPRGDAAVSTNSTTAVSCRSESNREPAHYECAALPVELQQRGAKSGLRRFAARCTTLPANPLAHPAS